MKKIIITHEIEHRAWEFSNAWERPFPCLEEFSMPVDKTEERCNKGKLLTPLNRSGIKPQRD